MSDDQLDDLFRQAASGYEPPFDPEAWKRMEQKLGGDQYFKSAVKRFTLIEALVVLSMLGLFWWASHGPIPTKMGTEPSETAVVREAKPSTRVESVTTLQPSSAQRNPEASPFASSDSKKAIRTTNEDTSVNRSSTIRQTLKPIHRPTTPSRYVSKAPLVASDVSPRKARTFSSRSQSIFEYSKRQSRRREEVTLVPSLAVPQPMGSADTSITKLETNALATLSWKALPVDLAFQVPEIEQPNTLEASVPQPQPRWALQLMLSPDFTRVPGRRAATGVNTGLQLEYRLAPRWRVTVGVVYSLKNYAATSYDYRPYKGYWTTYHRPDQIDATCRMLDLPLSVTFDAWKIKQNQFFVSLGSTSYLMLRENYRYQYATYEYDIEKKRTGNHWLATVNLSLGFERPITSRLQLRIEPFVKMPLGGVGFGNVRLRTEGVFFILRYHLQKPTIKF